MLKALRDPVPRVHVQTLEVVFWARDLASTVFPGLEASFFRCVRW